MRRAFVERLTYVNIHQTKDYETTDESVSKIHQTRRKQNEPQTCRA